MTALSPNDSIRKWPAVTWNDEMCMYCMCGDFVFRRDPPWTEPITIPQQPMQPWHPAIPQPLPDVAQIPWPIDKLKEYYELLKGIKELEDKLGCPCEPNKANYIELFEKRIAALEKKASDLS